MSVSRVNKKFLSDVDTRDLIKEIRNRRGLYDISALEQPRREHKHQLWQEVGECLTDTDLWKAYTSAEREARLDEIREKWRHLRNNFLREIKCMRSGEKKRKYIFYDDMEFMTPFVGIKIRGPSKSKLEKDDDSDAESTEERKLRNPNKIRRPQKYEESSVEYPELADSSEEEDANEGHATRSRTTNIKRKLFLVPKNATTKQTLTKEQERIIQHFDIIKKMPRKVIKLPPAATSTAKKPANPIATTTATRNVIACNRFFDMRDSDISFCMSMVSTFRKMGEAKKLRAKIDMLKVLHRYAGDLDESPKARVKVNQSQRNKPEVSKNNFQTMEEDWLENTEEEHSMENGEAVKNEAKLNEDPNNVWWT